MKKTKPVSNIYMVLCFVILYAPVVVMMLFSFNETESIFTFSGFSTRWYQSIFHGGEAVRTLRNSLILALTSSVISTLVGTAAAIGIFYMKRKWLRNAVMQVTNIPMMNPDIVTGISMMLLFVMVSTLVGRNILSFWTILIAHITFSLPYVILSVMPKLRQLDPNLSEAALDLGCTPAQAFCKVELPAIVPGILSGMIMAFTLSLDDFVISYFTTSASFKTFPTYVYSLVKKPFKPNIYALSSIMTVTVLLLLIISNILSSRDAAQNRRKTRKKPRVRTAAMLFACTLALSYAALRPAVPARAADVTLNIYNWGEYLSYDDPESYDVLIEFERYYESVYGRDIQVNYTEFDSNETLYARIKNGVSGYDVVIPSDYMIARLIEEGLLEKLNFDNIPNFRYIDDGFKGLYYDPQNEYSVPYTYCRVGIIYNTAQVAPEDVTGSWDLMWNRNYTGKILQFNNSRDAFGTAMYKLGIDVNTEDPALWEQARDEMLRQKPLVKSFVMDEVFGEMINGDAAIAAYYAGDFLTMYEENPDLAFYYPDEGTNLFVDAMCVPKGCQNKEAAEIFINFMLSHDAAVANAEYTCYASPNSLVYEDPEYAAYISDMHEDAMNILYPEDFDFHSEYERYCFHNLDRTTLNLVNNLWEEVKLEDSLGIGVYVLGFSSVGIVAVGFIVRAIVRRRRARYYD